MPVNLSGFIASCAVQWEHAQEVASQTNALPSLSLTFHALTGAITVRFVDGTYSYRLASDTQDKLAVTHAAIGALVNTYGDLWGNVS